MSQEAYETYQKAAQKQRYSNEARRIRTRIDQARKNQHAASLRWPFELFQNALDSGPRDTNSQVNVRLGHTDSRVIFQHDGGPFTSRELAALLSGGSSKELESPSTTGRFGTGFLVTHVLAEKVRLNGLMRVNNDSYELFELTLDRSGSEETILSNIRQSEEDLRSAKKMVDITNVLSVTIEYEYDQERVWDTGIRELQCALPYLYGTRPQLGTVELWTGSDLIEKWIPSEAEEVSIDDGCLERRAVHVIQDEAKKDLLVYRFTTAPDSSAAALVLVESTNHDTRICLPDPKAPRIFREYPIRSSGFVPLNFVLDGKFDSEQERNALLMSDRDKTRLRQALSSAVVAVKYAIDQRWSDAHRLAHASCPRSGFDATNPEETKWWTGVLAGFARDLAGTPIVDCGEGFFPAISDGAYANFIIPRLRDIRGPRETSVDRLWPLFDAVKSLLPPRHNLAAEWTEIAEGWSGLGLELGRVCVAELAKRARADATTLEELDLDISAPEWIARYVDIVGECCNNRSGSDYSSLDGLLPSQRRRLRSASQLRLDRGISETLKKICDNMGYDVRNDLLLDGFETLAESLGLQYLQMALARAISTGVAEDDIISHAVEQMTAKLPEGKRCDQAIDIHHAAVRLLDHLWHSRGADSVSMASQIPLLAANGLAVRSSSDRPFMAPPRTWPTAAQPFAHAYPPNRVLNDLYAGSDEHEVPNVTPALANWGIALVDPVIRTTHDLQDRRLAALTDEQTAGVVIPRLQMSQIALLQPEVLNRCQDAFDRAKALLGLVLCHVARHDETWKQPQRVQGTRQDEHIELSIRRALWIADLKVRAWVPVPGEDGQLQKMVASPATIKDLLDVTWLHDNNDAIELLSECFGFDQLELRLMGITRDDGERDALRTNLAKLIEVGGADAKLYARLAEEVEADRQRHRDVERCRNLGLAVQEAIGAALSSYNLDVELVDRGFDYKVAVSGDDVFADAGRLLEIGSYLVEVKSTQTGQARLTPTQAATASATVDRYVLCVVDLRQARDAELESWTPESVEKFAKMVPDVGNQVRPTYKNVEAAKHSMEVSIRNDSALRYEVTPELWEAGMSIAAWVESIRTTLS